jgi:hypothetical protein
MKRWLTVAVVCAACGGKGKGTAKDAAAPAGDDAAAPAAVVTGRTCTPAHFAGHGGTAVVDLVEIAADCTSRVVATLDTGGEWVFAAAWPRHDRPLALAVGERDGGAARRVMVFESPLTAGARARHLDPPGDGEIEPEGHVFSLVSDGQGVFVERCESWDAGDQEESEEWRCTRHTYFALGDKAGRAAAEVEPAPRDAFEPRFTGGVVPGTAVTLQPRRTHLDCIVDGKTTRLDPWTAAHGFPVTPLVIVPVSATEYLLGVEHNGTRMGGARSIGYDRMRGCAQVPPLGGVTPGPAPYWAEHTGDDGWRIHLAGDPAGVLDAAGQPARFAYQELAWTQP